MFRRFESLVDPYADYPQTDRPPRRLWPFMLDYARPFKRVFIVAGILSVTVAAVELGLIWAMGWVVDILSGDPAQVWADHGTALIALGVFVLLIRPAFQALDVLVLNNAIMPNFGTLIRWRAHRHVLRQSVGWFENDFAGRIANRIIRRPPPPERRCSRSSTRSPIRWPTCWAR
ncbi:ATP-binding cassette, subfamily B, multidrug efflux pump [Citreimonas salinaria]|uniref:ATP-binding cassette, subfamily B, multidrug efflux pump n=1 Tax=Citreimonas salinaria TaxID=321339 RepID=A0A1H3FDR2_9RHOB|nr:ATP-binding cassette, subfamily B, multidrug efflux pump [Citreimonas salinaria]